MSAVATNKLLAERLEDIKLGAKANVRRASRKLPPKDRRQAAQLVGASTGAGGLLDAESLAQLMAEEEEEEKEGEEQEEDAQARAIRRSLGGNDDDDDEGAEDGNSSEGYYDA